MIVVTPLKRTIFFILFDIILSLSTLFFAYILSFNFHLDDKYMESFAVVFLVLLGFKILAMWYFRLYSISWRFVSISEVKKIFYAHILAYSLFMAIFYIFHDVFVPFPRSILMIDFFLSILFIGLLRLSKRLIIERGGDSSLTKTLLIGVSPLAQTLIKEPKDYYISAVADDSDMLISSYFSNIRVHKLDDIEMLVQRESIKAVIIAKPFDTMLQQSIYKRLNRLGIYNIRVLSLEKESRKLKKVTVEDLLARHPKDLDLDKIERFISGKSILITGAGGSIGSEIARQCSDMGAKSLTLVDSSEYNLYQIGEQIDGARLRLVSVTDRDRLEDIFDESLADLVIHAAAYKHVPICEENKAMAVWNNIQGTKNVIDISIQKKVAKVVIISTDKAVRPTNVMGATKRVTELYANNVISKSTEIVAVRFGNVLGSSGSVIPKFKQQIEDGKSVTVTHPDITRYFMLIPEACQLVLQTASIAKGGELFILDMGEPIKIAELAKNMIKLYGKEDEIEIEFTGLRAGEKLYEELLLDESEKKTQYSSIFIAKPTKYDIRRLNRDIANLMKSKDKVKALQKIVPEFVRK